MKGILLAGGLGTRFYPVTRVVNKHILPVVDKPMFYYPLQILVDSGIKEVAVVSGPPFGDQIKQLLKFFPTPSRVKTVYVNQPQPTGMPDAVARCKQFAGSDSVMVIAGDNVYKQNFATEVREFTLGALSFLRKVSDPTRYGVPRYDKKGKLIKIEEKPRIIGPRWVVSGPHFFDNQVFKLIKNLQPSARGELEIADLNNEYLKMHQLKLVKRFDFWSDMGTFDSLLTSSLKIKRRKT